MDLREMRGMEIAATRTIRKQDGWWKVPSQNGPGLYRVQIAKKFSTCECPDFAKRQTACKHIYAATFVMKREKGPDGTTTVTQSVTFTEAHEITYSQPWSNVESAFSMMKRKFGGSLRSKGDTAMVNEALCKILCHNLVVLIHEIAELGIEPVFWSPN